MFLEKFPYRVKFYTKHEGGLYVKNGELQYDAKVHPVKNMVSSEMTSTHTTEALHKKLHSPHYAGL